MEEAPAAAKDVRELEKDRIRLHLPELAAAIKEGVFVRFVTSFVSLVSAFAVLLVTFLLCIAWCSMSIGDVFHLSYLLCCDCIVLQSLITSIFVSSVHLLMFLQRQEMEIQELQELLRR